MRQGRPPADCPILGKAEVLPTDEGRPNRVSAVVVGPDPKVGVLAVATAMLDPGVGASVAASSAGVALAAREVLNRRQIKREAHQATVLVPARRGSRASPRLTRRSDIGLRSCVGRGVPAPRTGGWPCASWLVLLLPGRPDHCSSCSDPGIHELLQRRSGRQEVHRPDECSRVI
jgi:hypothetical protein